MGCLPNGCYARASMGVLPFAFSGIYVNVEHTGIMPLILALGGGDKVSPKQVG